MSHRALTGFVLLLLALLFWLGIVSPARAEVLQNNPGVATSEYVLGPGDIIRITVFQNPDLTTETRVAETGAITFPLIGTVTVGALSVPAAERAIASLLRDGGFVLHPQVSILPVQMRGNQISVIGLVGRPGRYPLETTNLRLSDMLAMAGGIAPNGADTVVLIGTRGGKAVREEIDIPSMFLKGGENDLPLAGGDILYVHRAPTFYIYGEVQRPGTFRLERNMSVMQGLATGGGVNQRGTTRGLQVHRRDAEGRPEIIEATLDHLLKPDDVIFVKESLF
ncbi:polysaccharide export protein EpsE [Aromatoleum diolicum]|uniref:Polysaccharide export protein EpsE n=1 Tax=Aromatoleum diolicum TaxID=75796 RepID=A0ABX1QE01_9RHOO|nr:polysaccharide export protein EpsE [Aromatoleum diolicum]NMG76656.1 polysaccharide export protein EpsE [Aromatoleum diolicum]